MTFYIVNNMFRVQTIFLVGQMPNFASTLISKCGQSPNLLFLLFCYHLAESDPVSFGFGSNYEPLITSTDTLPSDFRILYQRNIFHCSAAGGRLCS